MTAPELGPVYVSDDEPAADTKIWRYMSLEKFESLVRERRLVFVSPFLFIGEPFEGSYTVGDIEKLRKNVLDNPEHADRVLHNAGIFQWANTTLCAGLFVNCWHIFWRSRSGAG